jgi:hypothetical protein
VQALGRMHQQIAVLVDRLDLQPCRLLLGLAPTGRRRLVTAKTEGSIPRQKLTTSTA